MFPIPTLHNKKQISASFGPKNFGLELEKSAKFVCLKIGRNSHGGYGSGFFWDWLVKLHDNSFQTPYFVGVEDFFEVRFQLIMLCIVYKTFLGKWYSSLDPVEVSDTVWNNFSELCSFIHPVSETFVKVWNMTNEKNNE